MIFSPLSIIIESVGPCDSAKTEIDGQAKGSSSIFIDMPSSIFGSTKCSGGIFNVTRQMKELISRATTFFTTLSRCVVYKT